MIRGRITRKDHGGEPAAEETFEIHPGELSRILDVPEWLKNVGVMSWLLLGVALLLAALVWLASLVQVIVIPVIVAGIVAAIGSPLVGRMNAHRVPRGVGATLVLALIALAAAGCALLLVHGIVSEIEPIGSALDEGLKSLSHTLRSLGVNPHEVDAARSGATAGANSAISALLKGVMSGISGLSSALFFLAMTVLSLFFLLKDGPVIRNWIEGHSGLPPQVSRIASRRAIGSLRAYFLGVTIIATFNAAVVLAGALIIGVPLIGTIVVATFVGGFIPFLGAWVAGIFSVVIAWGAGGMDAAIAMAAVQVLANGVLQQVVQPFAMGSVLGIHPLAVLVVTIAGGALFGSIGLIVAAPLVSALVGISGDLKRAREAAAAPG